MLGRVNKLVKKRRVGRTSIYNDWLMAADMLMTYDVPTAIV